MIFNNMPHICYIYIYDYQCLHNVDITFDHRYNYSYNPDEAVLNYSILRWLTLYRYILEGKRIELN